MKMQITCNAIRYYDMSIKKGNMINDTVQEDEKYYCTLANKIA